MRSIYPVIVAVLSSEATVCTCISRITASTSPAYAAAVKPLEADGCSRRLLASALQMPQIEAKGLWPQLRDFIERPATRAEDRFHRPGVFDQRQPVPRDAHGPTRNVLRHIRRQEGDHRCHMLRLPLPSRHRRRLTDTTLGT